MAAFLGFPAGLYVAAFLGFPAGLYVAAEAAEAEAAEEEVAAEAEAAEEEVAAEAEAAEAEVAAEVEVGGNHQNHHPSCQNKARCTDYTY
ncbi:hypothetical protein ES708_32506 [subsurface metagenome]